MLQQPQTEFEKNKIKHKITTLQLLVEVCGLLFGIKWKETKALVWIHAPSHPKRPSHSNHRNQTLIIHSVHLCVRWHVKIAKTQNASKGPVHIVHGCTFLSLQISAEDDYSLLVCFSYSSMWVEKGSTNYEHPKHDFFANNLQSHHTYILDLKVLNQIHSWNCFAAHPRGFTIFTGIRTKASPIELIKTIEIAPKRLQNTKQQSQLPQT